MFEMPYLREEPRAHDEDRGGDRLARRSRPWPRPRATSCSRVWENGFRHITNNSRPIVKPADLQGLKLRVPEGKWRVKMFQAYGANPSPMALSEVFVALQTGVMDGQENPLTQIYSSKFQEVQKFLSLTGHVYTPAYLAAGLAQVRVRCRPTCQAILTQAAKDTQAYVYDQAAKLDNELLGKMKSSGIKVNDADKDAFIAASKGVYEEFAQGGRGRRRARRQGDQPSARASERARRVQRLRIVFERALTAFVILLLAAMAVLILAGVRPAQARHPARSGTTRVASILLAWLTYYGAGAGSARSARTSAFPAWSIRCGRAFASPRSGSARSA